MWRICWLTKPPCGSHNLGARSCVWQWGHNKHLCRSDGLLLSYREINKQNYHRVRTVLRWWTKRQPIHAFFEYSHCRPICLRFAVKASQLATLSCLSTSLKDVIATKIGEIVCKQWGAQSFNEPQAAGLDTHIGIHQLNAVSTIVSGENKQMKIVSTIRVIYNHPLRPSEPRNASGNKTPGKFS